MEVHEDKKVPGLEALGVQVTEYTPDKFVCGQCQENLESLTAFLLHKVQHVDMNKAGACPLCGLAFSRQVSLREHLHRKHNIPELRCGSGKRRGRPRKEVVCEELAMNKSDMGGREEKTPAPASSHPESFGDQDTVHVIVDKISDGALPPFSTASLSNGVLHAECPEAYPPTSATVIVEACRGGDFSHLIQSEDRVSPPRAFQTPALQNQTFSLQSQSPPVDLPVDVQNSALENHLHLLQTQQTSEMAAEEKMGTSISAEDPVSMSEHQSPLSEQHIEQSASSTEQSASQEDGEADFLFVLVSNPVKKKAVSYSKQSFKCFHCHYKTFWRRALERHMRENHAEQLAIHQCIAVSCSEKVQGQQVMKMSEYLAVCARQRKQVNGHRVRGVERQDLPGYHPCTQCGKVFGRLRYLRKHQAIHGAEKKFLCDDCGKAFKTKAYLAAHRLTHQTKVYQCRQCSFSSSITVLIQAHRQLHNDHSVICEVCGSAYNDRATLKKHKQVHDESRPYACHYPGCTWRFNTEVMCRAHYRAHTTPGRFICQLCGYVFRHKHHLQRHLSKIHQVDEAAVYHATCSNSKVRSFATEMCEEDKGCEERLNGDDPPMTDAVSLIVNTGLSTEQLNSMLESGQFVIATDENDSSVNYEIANIAMNVSCDSLSDAASAGSQVQTMFVPNDAAFTNYIPT